MARLKRIGKNFFFSDLSQDEIKAIEGALEKEFELIVPKNCLLLFAEKAKEIVQKPVEEKSKPDEIGRRVFSLLEKAKLSDRVEGKFEKLLPKPELEKFRELLKKGEIEKFRLSEKYEKSIYRKSIGKEQEAESGVIGSVEECFERFNNNGFLLLGKESIAKDFSQSIANEIRNGTVLGIRNFDKEFCIIDLKLFERTKPLVINYLKKKRTAFLEQLSKELNKKKELIKIVCEISKESGDLIEKRKEEYTIIE